MHNWPPTLLPVQIGEITRLAQLELNSIGCHPPVDDHPLLTALTYLRLDNCYNYRGFLLALPELRRLEVLQYCDDDEFDSEFPLGESLDAVRQLTSLSLDWPSWMGVTPPDSITCLTTNLRSLHCGNLVPWTNPKWPRAGGQRRVAGSLPPAGAWSSGLRELGIASSCAFKSLAALRSMPLQQLRLYCRQDDSNYSAAWERLLEVVGMNEELQILEIIKGCAELTPGADGGFDVDSNLSGALLRLQRAHPGLKINCIEAVLPQDRCVIHD